MTFYIVFFKPSVSDQLIRNSFFCVMFLISSYKLKIISAYNFSCKLI